MLAPKPCDESGKEQDCLVAVDFVNEDESWKIDNELVAGKAVSTAARLAHPQPRVIARLTTPPHEPGFPSTGSHSQLTQSRPRG